MESNPAVECSNCELGYIKNSNPRVKCPQCEMSYTHKPSVKRHIKTIHEKLTYACSLCSKVYSYKNSLKRHIKRSHIEPVNHTTVSPVV